MEMHHSPNKQFYEAGLGLTQILWVCLDGSFWRGGEERRGKDIFFVSKLRKL
jgi:hypothetical protein